MGDMIQHIRYAPLVAQRGWQVVARCPSGLEDLLRSNPELGWIAAADSALPECDAYCPIMSLPLIFKDQTIPTTPYLRADPDRVQKWKRKLGEPDGRARIGIVWAGNPLVEGDRSRSTTLNQLSPLASLRGIRFYSLQKGKPAAQADQPPPAWS